MIYSFHEGRNAEQIVLKACPRALMAGVTLFSIVALQFLSNATDCEHATSNMLEEMSSDAIWDFVYTYGQLPHKFKARHVRVEQWLFPPLKQFFRYQLHLIPATYVGRFLQL